MIGRNRKRAASMIDCLGVNPRVRSASSAKSIIMIAFFLTMPINNMMPINATNDKSWPVTFRAMAAPMPAEGNVVRIVNGWMRLSYSTPSTI